MKNKRRKTRDLNRLSAYLDKALPAREMRELEARLAVDPELREKLNNLHRTKLALSRLTRVRAPRNFTLTPDMVPARKPRQQPLRGTLRLASALAAILLVVLFSVEFILGEVRQPQMMAAEAPAMESADLSEESSPEPLIQWGPPGRGEPEGMGGNSFAMEQPAPEEEDVPEIESLPQEQPEILEEKSESPAAKGGDLILGINADEGGEIIERSEPAVTQPEPAPLPWPDIIKWAQIALVAIAVGGGLALLILRRRSQPKQ